MPEVLDDGSPVGIEVDDTGAPVGGGPEPRARGTGPLAGLLRGLTGLESIEEADRAWKAQTVADRLLSMLPGAPLAGMAVHEPQRVLERLKEVRDKEHLDEKVIGAVGALPLVGGPLASASETLGRGDVSGFAVEAPLAALNAVLLRKGYRDAKAPIVARRAARAAEEAARIKAQGGFHPVEEPFVVGEPQSLPLDVAAALQEAPKNEPFTGETGPALRAAGVPAPETGPPVAPGPRPAVPPLGTNLPEVGTPPVELPDLGAPAQPMDVQVGGAVPPALETGAAIHLPNEPARIGVISPETATAYEKALQQISDFIDDVEARQMPVSAILEKYGLPQTTATSREAAQLLAGRARAVHEGATPAPGVAEVSRADLIPSRGEIPWDVFSPPAEIPNTLREWTAGRVSGQPKPIPPDPSVSSVPLAPETPPAPKPVTRAPSTGIGFAPEDVRSGSSLGGPAREIPLSRLKHVEEFKMEVDDAGRPTYGGDLGSAIDKLASNITGARRASRATKALQAQERGKRSARAMEIMRSIGGEQGLAKSKRALAGELPAADFEPIGNLFSKKERGLLFDAIIAHPELEPFERIRAYDALTKVMDGGAVPQPNETQLLGRAFGPDVAEAIAAKAHRAHMNWLSRVWNLPRFLMSGPDLSYPFRQFKRVMSSPYMFKENYLRAGGDELGGNFGNMVRAYLQRLGKNPGEAFHAKNLEIAHRPNAPLYKLAGVEFTDKASMGDVLRTEEAYQMRTAYTQWLSKIPGVGKYAAKHYMASEEAALTFANGTRADLFDSIARPYQRRGMTYESHPQIFNAIGKMVNNFAGRGGLGPLEGAAYELSQGLYAPKLMSANFQSNLWNPYMYVKLYRADPGLLRRYIVDQAAFYTSRATVLSLLAMAGAKLNDDPRSAEFGKVRVGRARLDVWGGDMQVNRALSQLYFGEKTQLTGERVPVDRGDVVLEFLKQRRHPTLVFAWNEMRQKGDRGEPIDHVKEVGRILAALPAQDLKALAEQEPKALWMMIPAWFGSSITLYDEPAVLSEADKKALRASEAAAAVSRKAGRELRAVKPKPHQQSPQEREAFKQSEARRRQTELELWALIDDKHYAKARQVARTANQEYGYQFKVDKMIRARREQTPREEEQ